MPHRRLQVVTSGDSEKIGKLEFGRGGTVQQSYDVVVRAATSTSFAGHLPRLSQLYATPHGHPHTRRAVYSALCP